MNWNNLKDGLCPKCEYRLRERVTLSIMYPEAKSVSLECENSECGFKCGQAKAREIIQNLKSPRLSLVGIGGHRPRYDEVDENLGLLNNL